MNYEPVIGLEVHVQLKTKSKLFCPCPTTFGEEGNRNTCPVCLGWPGSLPVVNEEALRLGIKAGLALNCKVAERLKFDRKNYFYPDLPKAYQISQYDMPVNGRGEVLIETKTPDGKTVEKKIGITRAHLEEDAGKLLHEGIVDGSLVDYNRGGVPLLEIVSEPDIRSPQEAYDYLTALKAILRYAEVSDCDMEKGSLRCDANVSVRPVGQEKFGTKVEIKNLNSFKMVQRAIQCEIARQIEAITDGETIVQETRLWNDAKGMTFSMRSKEDAHDYRYFPDPDLVPFTLTRETVEAIRKTLPELPLERAKRFMRDHGLPEYDACTLVEDKKVADYFEECLKGRERGQTPFSEDREKVSDPFSAKRASNWILTELLALLNAKGLTVENCPVAPKAFAGLLNLIEGGTISGKIAKDVLGMMFETGKDAETLVKEKGLVQVSDAGLIEEAVEKAIAANPNAVAEFKAGKQKAVGAIVGFVMKETGGKANPKVVNEILCRKLKN
ncbi:MAG TPA: Asp-tRNA(Asn)/Glu-tRNA(Gln) amidotransferase subunit GatB [Candidatus Omnitrophota bacterium]|jgi:aspartyl-tRNA(Asn)/glutamyl-tRNA(Gln) amidotransferase subunit B|nr:Asp-tRNA(Asn)/Glu-tRNA(Gln) amidotransferase subunit GatB [Candidatus Omnitrophota bacterium]HPW64951.1 Asp-tRNA(Asn)/Glu-tRNA(Gln) amidotransferase subunit GatB [Candidatus Omnitrophota bacterium]